MTADELKTDRIANRSAPHELRRAFLVETSGRSVTIVCGLALPAAGPCGATLCVMPRVVIVGSSCAGKTTLARELATTLAHPHIELDALHWMPDWQERAVDEFRAVLAREIAAGAWVLDGNYLSQAQDIVWPRATHVVWLNYSFPVVMKRALVRTVRRSLVREHLWSGNRESWRRSFMSRDSILLWVVTSFRDRRRTLRQLFDNPDLWPEIDHIELTHPSQAGPLVRQMERLSCLQAR